MEKKKYDPIQYPFQDQTEAVILKGIEIHKTLGTGFLEIVYKDAFEYEFKSDSIFYEREKEYKIFYKDVCLPHYFYADFVVFGNIILEVKAKEGGIAEEDYAQTLNYIRCAECKVGLILNFGKSRLEIKRVVF